MLLCVIDLDRSVKGSLAVQLAEAGFVAQCFQSVTAAAKGLRPRQAKAILIDQGCEAPQSAATISALREAGLAQPIVILAGRDDWRERVASYNVGADAVLVKPVHPAEIAACLTRLIAARELSLGERLVFGDIEIDMNARCAWRAGSCLTLTRNEFRLLQCLLLAKGRNVSKRQLIESLWVENRTVGNNALEVLIKRLRLKLGRDRIVNTRAVGYRLSLPSVADEPRFHREPCRRC